MGGVDELVLVMPFVHAHDLLYKIDCILVGGAVGTVVFLDFAVTSDGEQILNAQIIELDERIFCLLPRES